MGSFNLITLEKPGPDELPLQPRLNEALVRELLLAARGGAIGLLGAVLLYAMLVEPWTSNLGAALFAALIGITLIRLFGSIWGERIAHRHPPMRLYRWLVVVYCASGCCLAAIMLASYPELPLVRVLMLLVIMIAINSTAMVTLAASPTLWVIYIAPPFLAWNVVAYTQPLPGLEHVLQPALPIYAVAALVTMRSVHRSLRNNVVLRLRLAASLDELRDAQTQLLAASRQAGRSDVATAVLHNVGNVLNSVNVSASLVNDIIGQLRTGGLASVATLISEHRTDLGGFFRDDHRGQKLPDYFSQLHSALEHDKTAAVTEMQSLIRNIDHIKVIVASQQSYVAPNGAVETLDVRQLIDDALRFSATWAEHDAIEVVREFDELPDATLDRHKAMQIVSNLLANARDAVLTRPAGQRRIAVRARRTGPGVVEIAVEDNGCGIAADQLERIFELGFTTKPRGNGLGLHYSACAARELRGNLTARSAGAGLGATFLLVLPLEAA